MACESADGMFPRRVKFRRPRILSASLRKASRRGSKGFLRTSIFVANVTTNGFCPGDGSMNPCICLMVAFRINLGGMIFFAARARDPATASSMRVFTWRSAATCNSRHLFSFRQWVPDGQSLNQIDICAIHLFERECVVEIRLLADDGIELPLHQIGGDALDFCQFSAIELLKLCEALFRELNTRTVIGDGLRSQLAFEAVLFIASKIAILRWQD